MHGAEAAVVMLCGRPFVAIGVGGASDRTDGNHSHFAISEVLHRGRVFRFITDHAVLVQPIEVRGQY